MSRRLIASRTMTFAGQRFDPTPTFTRSSASGAMSMPRASEVRDSRSSMAATAWSAGETRSRGTFEV